MFVKWISCTVPAPRRRAFSAAQAAWSTIGDQPGLVGQLGGWVESGQRALILSVWDDAASYDDFMAVRHDDLVRTLGQGSTYRAIAIATGPTELVMAGTSASLADALAGSSVLRVGDCIVRPERRQRFVEVQREVWAPAMAAAGMRGGCSARLDESRHLVTTFWPDLATQPESAIEQLPGSRVRAAVRGRRRADDGSRDRARVDLDGATGRRLRQPTLTDDPTASGARPESG